MNQQSIVSFFDCMKISLHVSSCGTIDLNLNFINTLRHKYMCNMNNTTVHKNKLRNLITVSKLDKLVPIGRAFGVFYSRPLKYTQHTACFTDNNWAPHLLLRPALQLWMSPVASSMRKQPTISLCQEQWKKLTR